MGGGSANPAHGDGPVLGILGGMGPLVSARFVQHVYELNITEREQQMPRVLLDSDPGFPDRTEAIRTGRVDDVATLLATRVDRLIMAGATQVVVACMTAHHFFGHIGPLSRDRIISLVDTAIGELSSRHGTFLLLATSGSRQAQIFQSAPGWAAVADRVVLPTDDDQNLIHQLVYRIKRCQAGSTVLPNIEVMLARYGCDGVILGCTEFHLYTRQLAARYGTTNVVDALWSIAVNLNQDLAAPTPHRSVVYSASSSLTSC